MAELNDIKDVGSWVVFFSFYSTILLNITVIVFTMLHDYAFLKIYDVFEIITKSYPQLVMFLDELASVINASHIIYSFFDWMWVLSFVIFIFVMFYASYNLRRPNYFSLLFYIGYGISILIFLLNIFLQVSGWINNVFITNMLSVSLNLPFYTLYYENVGVVSSIILAICILLNFVDFDFITYNIRKKEQRQTNDEI